MYSVKKQVHTQYGNVVEIAREELAEFVSPFDAYRKAVKVYKEWKGNTKIKIRVLVDSQVMTLSDADSWSINEYKTLPKCESCGKILDGKVFLHQLSGEKLFCSQDCADKDYVIQVEKSNDNEESEFDCI